MLPRLALRSVVAAALFGCAFTIATPAHAQVEVGVLTCRSPGSAGYVVGSVRQYACVFAPSTGAPIQYYRATIYRFGAQIGVSNETGLGWIVTALTARPGPGSIAGRYGGASAGAAVLLGARANVLVGGANNAFALQPVSAEGETGLNVVATVTGLDLQPVVPARRLVRRHRR